MRKTILAAIVPALLVAGISAPAIAREGDYRGGSRAEAAYQTPARNAEIRQDINGLNRQIDRAQARRTISPREATGLRRDARELQRLYARYARGGLSRDEYRTLERRVGAIHARLHFEKHDRDGRRG